MEYIYVGGASDLNSKNKFLLQLISRQTGGLLYSLIDGMNKKESGCLTMSKVANSINTCHDIFENGKLFIDSGGYSIIKGIIPEYDIYSVIKEWEYYTLHHKDDFDYLFSLDIPISIKYNQLNTKQKIYEFNTMSLKTMIKLVEEFPELKKKLFFVWHFKMHNQYEIWKRMYDELELSKYIQNRAIGGMVGVRKATGIKFSPFIGMAFRSLLDFINAETYNIDFRIHFLGVYNPYDRFTIALLEKLCEYYLENKVTAKFSYDSINFAHTARMNTDLPIYIPEGEYIHICRSINDVPEIIMKNIYTEKFYNEYIEDERTRRENYQNLKNSSAFSPININSNMNLDRFFERCIKKYALVDFIVNSKSITTTKKFLNTVLHELNKIMPWFFDNHITESIIRNVEEIYTFNEWFLNKRTYKTFDERMLQFINNIHFPNMIS